MGTHVFLGPSLPVAQARRLHPQMVFHPPAVLGDLHRLADDPAVSCLVLIDGGFLGTPAVWHKEIAFALSRGIQVFGASSMGALRAAEMHTLGMQGVGAVFERYRDGHCEDDDEVAVLHAPAELDHACCSIAMISLRHALAEAVGAGWLAAVEADGLAAAMKRLHFSERTWERLAVLLRALRAPQAHDAGQATAGPARADAAALLAFLAAPERDLKRLDALAVLQHAARVAGTGGRRPAGPFEETCFWRDFIEEQAAARTAAIVDAEALLHASQLRETALAPLTAAWIELLEAQLARHLARQPGADAVADELLALRREQGLLQPSEVDAWCADSGLARDDLRQWALAGARRRQLRRLLRSELDAALVRELRRRRQFRHAADALGPGGGPAGPVAAEAPAVALEVAQLDALWRLCAERFGAFHGPPRALALRKGFDDEQALLRALVQEQRRATTTSTAERPS